MGSLVDKFKGCILGVALGDSLGAPFEGNSKVYEKVSLGNQRGELTYTDDTHETIAGLISLKRKKGFDLKDFAMTLAKNWEEEPWRTYSPNTAMTLRQILDGADINKVSKTGLKKGSFGNGSAMRVAPIALFYHNQPENLKRFSYESSAVTNSHELALEGAYLQSRAIALALMSEEEKLDKEKFLKDLEERTENEEYLKKLKSARGLLAKEKNKFEVIEELGRYADALNSVVTGIYSFLVNPEDFKEAVSYAISLGGDADTIGSMTGAISGAYLGSSKLPQQWIKRLEDKDKIIKLATSLFFSKNKKPENLWRKILRW